MDSNVGFLGQSDERRFFQQIHLSTAILSISGK